MEDNVLLTQGEKIRVQGQKLLYVKAQETAEMTGQPSWTMEERQGSADRLRLDRQNGVLTAEGQARIRLPRSTTSQSLWAFDTPQETSSPTEGEAYLEASARSYTMQPGLVRFDDNVRVQDYRHGEVNSQLTCGALRVHLKETNQIERIEAEQSVVLEQLDSATTVPTNQNQQLRCDTLRLTTTRLGGLDTAVAEGDVRFRQADRRVSCRQMVYQAATDQLVCTGTPVRVDSAEGNLVSDEVSLNRRENRRVARGNIQIQVDVNQAQATRGSNLLRTPLPARPGL
jgi:lipopolysaccharide assembly outer membrane protein LptD (OstA)